MVISHVFPNIQKPSRVVTIVYIHQDFIKPDSIERRDYQDNIARTASQANTLVVLPTGMGKTIIALLVMDSCSEWSPWLQNLFNGWVPVFAQIALYVTVALTAISGAIYLWRNRTLYLSDV